MLYYALLWCILIGCIVGKPDVLHLKTYDATVYASSTEVGSNPQYAVDHDFNASTPTCFLSSTNHSDASGFHWLIVDLGAITLGITEIRLTLGGEKNAYGVEDIDIFTAAYLHSSHIHKTTQSTPTVDLPWDSYEFCNNTSNEFLTPYGAVVLCSPSKSGKWILLRRKTKPLYLCLLAVYVESKSHECFEEVRVSPDGEPEVPAGSVFRLERHVTHGQCRESCMETPVCQAIAFLLRRRTGMCYLLQQFNRTDDSSSAPFTCMPGQNCKIEENICHRGRVFPLVPAEDKRTNKWRIQVSSILPDDAIEIRNLYAVQMKGKATCKSSNCDLLEISVIDEFGEAYTCTRLDLTVISVLDKLPAYCELSDQQSKVSLVVLQLIPGGENNTELDMKGGYIQLFDNTRPSALIREVPTIPKMFPTQLNAFENETKNYEHEASNEPLHDTDVTIKSGYSSMSTEAAIPHTTSPELKYAGMEEDYVSNPTGSELNEDALHSTYKAEINEPIDTASIDETLNAFENQTENYEHEASNEPLPDMEVIVKIGYTSTSTEAAIPHTTSPELKYAGMEEEHVSHPTGRGLNEDALPSTYKAEINDPLDTALIDETPNNGWNQVKNYELKAYNESLTNTEAIYLEELSSMSVEPSLSLTKTPSLRDRYTIPDVIGFGVENNTGNTTRTTELTENRDKYTVDQTSTAVSIAGFQFDYNKIIIVMSVVSVLLSFIAILIIWACCTRSKKRSISK